jgi:hypothetical protein
LFAFVRSPALVGVPAAKPAAPLCAINDTAALAHRAGRAPIVKLTMSVETEPAGVRGGSVRAVHQSTTSLIWIMGVALV